MTASEIAKKLQEMGIRTRDINYNERIVTVWIFENRKYTTPQQAMVWMKENGFEMTQYNPAQTPAGQMVKILRAMTEQEAMTW